MKKKILSAIFVTILAFFLVPLSAICGEMDKDTQLIKYYENAINKIIFLCNSKAHLKESKSVHLQNCAAMEIKKATFFSENKERLIKEMDKRDIGVKQYKIEYFLNKKFYENQWRP